MYKLIDIDELKTLTDAQRKSEDRGAVELAKRSCIELTTSLGLSTKPAKPLDISSGNIGTYLKTANSRLYHILKDDGFALMLIWSMRASDTIIRLQCLSTMCYYLACNGYSIACNGDLRKVKNIIYNLDTPMKSEDIDAICGILQETVYINVVNTNENLLINGSKVPNDLIEYLQSKGSMLNTLREVIRLQELSSKHVLAEDPYGALLMSYKTTVQGGLYGENV